MGFQIRRSKIPIPPEISNLLKTLFVDQVMVPARGELYLPSDIRQSLRRQLGPVPLIIGSMADSRTQFIVDQVKALPIEEQLRVAEAIDRLTWAQRWREICERIARNVATVGAMNEDQIDAEVREVRRETPLSERSSIPRS